MPIPKTELNKRKRAERKANKEVEFRCWCINAKDREILSTHNKLMRKGHGDKK